MSWEDIGGLEEVKQRIREAVELPFKEPEALRRLGVVPPRGMTQGRGTLEALLCAATSLWPSAKQAPKVTMSLRCLGLDANLR